MNAQLDVQKSVTDTGIRVYSFSGELDAVNVDGIFSGIARDIGDFKEAKVILNFVGLTYINSKWLGWLADLSERTKDGSGKIVICNALPEILDTMEIAGIATIIPLCENERIAREQFLN